MDDSTILLTDGDSTRRRLQDLIDTANGEIDSYPDVSDDFSAVNETLSPGTVSIRQTVSPMDETAPELGRFENQVGYGASYTVDGEETTVEAVIVFLSEADVFTEDVEAWTRSDTFPLASDVSVESDGRVVTVDGQMRTRDFEYTLF